jgi:hypothetical protein
MHLLDKLVWRKNVGKIHQPRTIAFVLTTMINLIMFTSLCVDAARLQHFSGTGTSVHIIGILRELHNVDYNQECVVEMYDGCLVNIVDGPVSTHFFVIT